MVKFSSASYRSLGFGKNICVYIIYKSAGKRPGSEKKEKKANLPKYKGSCQCLYKFLTTQSKKSNLRRGLNHVPINQIYGSCIHHKKAVKISKKFNERFLSYGIWIVKITCF